MIGDINLPAYQLGKSLLNQSLTGHIHVLPIALQTLQPFIPDTRNLQGIINIDSTLQGTLQNPIIMGQLKLQNGQVTIPSLNITLNNVQLNATGQPIAPFNIMAVLILVVANYNYLAILIYANQGISVNFKYKANNF